MKLECTRKELLDALQFVRGGVSRRSSHMILTTVRLSASDSTLELLCCDGEIWVRRSILAKVEEPGAICVSFDLLQSLVSQLPDGYLTLSLEGGSAYLRTSASEWKLMTVPVDDFPEIEDVEGSAHLSMTLDELRQGVDSVAFACADDTSRPVLTGVLFTYDGNLLTLVATDTHRLAVMKMHKDDMGSQVTAIVPEKALQAIKNMPMESDDEIIVKFDETRLGVDAGSAKVVSQLLTGTYPNWERVVPQEHTRVWTIDRQEFIDNVKRAMILAKDTANRIRFSSDGEHLQIAARNEEGEAKEEVQVVSKNGEIDIAFNGRYVLDMLNSMQTDGIRAEMTEPSRPAVFRPVEGDDSRFCVIMPMALG